MNESKSQRIQENPIEDERRWRAVIARDRSHDGRFVLAVRTTGIYCRPSCPARRPLRRNVVFFAGPDDAERAGYRACLRCKPREAGAPDPQGTLVRRVCAYIDAHARDERITLADLAREVGLSPDHLQRTFRARLGITPRRYADAVRIGALKAGLKRKEQVTMAMYDAGYGSSSRLYERSNGALGMTPGDYRAGGRGAAIAYTVTKTPIGPMLVAATERGICSVRIGRGPDAGLDALKAEFPAARIRRDERALGRWVRAIVRHLSGATPRLDVPVDVRATAFQERVWAALRAIPYGETRSYQEVARIVGSPRAARAVGRACATNPVAVVIPCHRVVRGDGSLGGYAWGLGVKRDLLERERKRRSGRRSAVSAR
ncbi:MAG TPA: bifunctional DNA-binding transcriptional regulator/O6-methylguanine-DNA methyltransferase Ada [Candidatus Eisenbacteria bacterium]